MNKEQTFITPLTLINELAIKLREQNPKKYGTKGSKPGKEGYVKNGWLKARNDAVIHLRKEGIFKTKKERKKEEEPVEDRDNSEEEEEPEPVSQVSERTKRKRVTE